MRYAFIISFYSEEYSSSLPRYFQPHGVLGHRILREAFAAVE